MKIGYIGLGKMGYAMTLKLLEEGHEVLTYNRSQESPSYGGKILLALRSEFGGHEVEEKTV